LGVNSKWRTTETWLPAQKLATPGLLEAGRRRNALDTSPLRRPPTRRTATVPNLPALVSGEDSRLCAMASPLPSRDAPSRDAPCFRAKHLVSLTCHWHHLPQGKAFGCFIR